MPDLFFYPKSIAIIGASSDPKKFGNALTINILNSRYIQSEKCVIYLISHGSKEINGITTYNSILDITDISKGSGGIDLAIILVPARFVKSVVEECVKKKVKRIIIVTGGFGEINESGKSIEREIVEQCKTAEIRVIGPNCVGIENVDLGLNASFIQTPPTGNISMIAQSGSFACACFYEMELQNLGISKFANIGNQIDVSFVDILKFLKVDKSTEVICVYLEYILDGREIFKILKKITPIKPVIVLKGGKNPVGMKAAGSHTGSISSDYGVFKTAVNQAGCVVCENMHDYIIALKTLSFLPIPNGEKVGILTNSGGSSVLFSDVAEELGLTLAQFSNEFKEKISPFLIPLVKKVNPLDMIAGAAEEQYYQITKAMLEDPGIDIVVACSVIPPFLNIKPEEHYKGIIRAWNETKRQKPVIPLMVFGHKFEALKKFAQKEKATIFYTPKEAAFSVKILVDRMKKLEKTTTIY
ncbi:MAG: CoA-binding protein [Promethearchaeota archaeon]